MKDTVHKKRHFLAISVSVFFLVIISLIICFPTLLSSSWGQSFLCKKLEKNLNADINLRGLNLSWFSAQSLNSFSYKQKDGTIYATAEDMTNSSSLMSILINRKKLPLTQIASFDLIFNSFLIDGEKPASYPSSSLFHTKKKPLSLPFIQNFFVRKGKITLIGENNKKTELNELELRIQLNSKQSIVSTQGKTNAEGIEGIFSCFSTFSIEDFKYESSIQATHFPIQSIDDLFHFKGSLVETLGPVLNATASFKMNEETLDCSVDLLSSQFKASIHTTKGENSINLKKPSFISLTITPLLITELGCHLPTFSALSLSNTGSIQFFLDELNIPYSKRILDFQNLSYQGRLFSSSLNFVTKESKNSIVINSSTLTSSSKKLKDQASISLKTALNYNLKNPSYINTSITIDNPLDNFTFSNISLQINKFPLNFIEELLSFNQKLTDYLGNTLDLTISTKTTNTFPVFYIDLSTPFLKTEQLPLSLDQKSLVLAKATPFIYTPPQNILAKNIKPSGFIIDNLGLVRGSLDSLSLPLENFTDEGFNPISYKASLKSEDTALHSPYSLGKFKIKNSNFELNGETLDKANIKGSFSLAYMDDNPIQKILFGHLLSVNVETIVEKLTPDNLSIPYFRLNAINEKNQLSLACSLTDNLTKLSFLEPLSLDFFLSSLLLNEVFHVSSEFTNYSFPFPLKLSLNAEPFYINNNLFKNFIFSSTLGIEQFKITDKLYDKEFTVSSTLLSFKGDSTKKQLEGSFLSEIRPKTSSSNLGLVSGNYSSSFFDSLEFVEKPFHLSTQLDNFPTPFLDIVFGYNHALTTLIGNVLQSSISISHEKENALIEGNFKTPNITLSYAIDKTPKAFDLKNHLIEGNIHLKPDSYSALEEIFAYDVISKQTFSLQDESIIDIKINKLKWLRSDQISYPQKSSFLDKFFLLMNHHLNQSSIEGTLSTKKLHILCQETGQKTALQDVSLECIKTEGKAPFVLNLNSKILDNPSSSKHNTGHVIASIILQTIEKENQKSILSSKINGTLAQFPTMILDSAFQLAGFSEIPPSVFLGQKINATFESQLENLVGTFDFEVDSKDSKGTVHGYLNNKVLKLSEPIKAQIAITPTLADFFLKNMNISLSVAKEPLTLFIDNKGFYFPLDPFDLKTLQIRKASVNLGQIICNNLGNPEEIGTFFRLNLSKNNQISLWFAPMDFSITNGSAYIDRTEILFNQGYQIAFWGKLDLINKNVKMTLGLTEQSLQKALGIKGLPRSFVLQIPMEGPINNVQINKELATARITLLLAKTSGLTAYGGLWGGIAGALNEFANDQTTVPPARPPFPWEGPLSKQELDDLERPKLNIIR